MAKGLPKWAIKEAKRRGAKNIFAYAWSLIKKKKGTKRSSKTRRKSNPKRKVKRMARKKRSRRYSMTIPLAPVVGIAAALPIDIAMKGDINGFVLETKRRLTGFDESGGFHWDWLAKGLGPIVAGLLIHKFVGGSPLNLNRMLGRAKVPFLRI